MKLNIFLVLLVSLLFSCRIVKEKRNCFENTKNQTVLNINNFDDFKFYLEMENEDLNDVLWILDGNIIFEDSIEYVIDEKKFDILKVDKVHQSKLNGLCTNKHWSFAVLISTNNCLNRYK